MPLNQEAANLHRAGSTINTHHLRLLTWLLHYPLQRDADLALALGISTATICRHLGRLQAEGVVESVTPSGRTKGERLSYLTRGGLFAVASGQGADPARLARLWGADVAGLLRLLPRLPTLGLILEIINGLVAQAPQIFARQ
jgi:DNA-binding MarR family transcriptional regulator